MKGWILAKFPLGYPRCEYEIGRLVEAARVREIDAQVVTPQQVAVLTGEEAPQLFLDGHPVETPQFLLPRMGAETTYAGFSVIHQLESLGVPVINGSASIQRAQDKLYSQQLIAAHGLPVPRTLYMPLPPDFELAQREIGFPLVLKVVDGTEGVGVYLCRNRKELGDIALLIQATNPDINIILQEFVATSHGRDLRVIVIDETAVACMQRVSTDGDFKANFSRGGEVHPYPITPEVERLAIETARAHDLEVAGVDLLFAGPSTLRVCEINSAPGFRGMELSQDIDIAGLIMDHAVARVEAAEGIWAVA